MSTVGAAANNALQAYYAQAAAADQATTDQANTSTDPDASNKGKTAKPAPTVPAPSGTIFASTLMSALINAQSGGSTTDAMMSTVTGSSSTTDISDLIGAQANAQFQVQQTNLLNQLTPSDRALIEASGTTLPDTSDPTSTAGSQAMAAFVLQIASDRMSGRLTGDITQGYWQGLESRSSTGQEIDPQSFADGLKYLQDPTVKATASS